MTMKYCVIVILLSLTVESGACFAQGKSIAAHTGEEQFELDAIGKLVKGQWSNMGSWIILFDPSVDGLEESVVLTVSFHREFEEMSVGGAKGCLVEDFLRLVNDKYHKGVLLVGLKNDGYKLMLDYSDKSTIVWAYKNKDAPVEIAQ